MKVVLYNAYHAGDVILSRSLIARLKPLLPDLELRCDPSYFYLWANFELPMQPVDKAWKDVRFPIPTQDFIPVDLWFGHHRRFLREFGLTHQNQVRSYNVQAQTWGLPLLDEEDVQAHVDFGEVTCTEPPGVLVENGRVLSGQKVADVNPWLRFVAEDFPDLPFYCAAPPPNGPTNLVDVSRMDLIQLSALSEVCLAMISRLSGVTVATLTARNHQRLTRLVVGQPLPWPVWRPDGFQYFDRPEDLHLALRTLLEEHVRPAPETE